MGTSTGSGRATEARRGSDLRRRNAASILQALRERGPLPRVDLASELSVSSATITRLTAELVEAGLLRELDPVTSIEVGRRRVPIDLGTDQFLTVGVHIGVQWTTIGLVNLRGKVVTGPERITHADLDARSVIDEAVVAIDNLIAARPPGSQVIGTGWSSGGSIDQARGIVTAHDALGWHEVDLLGLVGERLPGPLLVESTFRAMASAEMWFGAAHDINSFVQIFLGQVIGAAFVFDGVLHDGAAMRAGRIAHLPVSTTAVDTATTDCHCGRPGCLTAVIRSIPDRARAAGLTEVATSIDLAQLGEQGNQIALEVLRERAEAIGEAVSLLLEILAPDRVVLAGAAVLGPQDLATVRTAVAQTVAPPIDVDATVVATALGDPAVANVVASATPVLKLFYDDPLAYAPDSGQFEVTR